MDEPRIDLDDFEIWLRTLGEDQEAGVAYSPINCPLARYLNSRYAACNPRAFVGGQGYSYLASTQESEDQRHFQEYPIETRRFVRALDLHGSGDALRSVTAGECLEVLAEVRGGK